MKALTYDALIELLHDPNPAIQEQALEIVRNLACGQQEVLHHRWAWGHLPPKERVLMQAYNRTLRT